MVQELRSRLPEETKMAPTILPTLKSREARSCLRSVSFSSQPKLLSAALRLWIFFTPISVAIAQPNRVKGRSAELGMLPSLPDPCAVRGAVSEGIERARCYQRLYDVAREDDGPYADRTVDTLRRWVKMLSWTGQPDLALQQSREFAGVVQHRYGYGSLEHIYALIQTVRAMEEVGDFNGASLRLKEIRTLQEKALSKTADAVLRTSMEIIALDGRESDTAATLNQLNELASIIQSKYGSESELHSVFLIYAADLFHKEKDKKSEAQALLKAWKIRRALPNSTIGTLWRLFSRLCTIQIEIGQFDAAKMNLQQASADIARQPEDDDDEVVFQRRADDGLLYNVTLDTASTKTLRQIVLYRMLIDIHVKQREWESAAQLTRQCQRLRETIYSTADGEWQMSELRIHLGNYCNDPLAYYLPRQLGSGGYSLAFQTWLLDWGRGLEAGRMAARSQTRAAAADDDDMAGVIRDLRQLQQKRDQLSIEKGASLSARDFAHLLHPLDKEIHRLKEVLAQGTADIRQELRERIGGLPLATLASRLPPDSALVGIVWADSYEAPWTPPSEADSGAPAHYLALILFSDGKMDVADLGLVSSVHMLAGPFVRALQDPHHLAEPSATALYRQLFEPIAKRLGSVRRIFVAPDGPLSIIPFDALHDGQRYLADRYDFSYLTSCRDLLDAPPPPSLKPPVIVANPIFSLVSTHPQDVQQPEAARSTRLRSLYDLARGLAPLPGTEAEIAPWTADGVHARILLGSQATELAFRAQVQEAPSVLVLASHALFVAAEQQHEAKGQPTVRERSSLISKPDATTIDSSPALTLTRREVPVAQTVSTILFAGAEDAYVGMRSDRDNHVTAEEVANSINLQGTQLVVLSACQTGWGNVTLGEGVTGLRRAFLLAGAESLVVSLWRIADSQTSELMRDYYERVLRGEPRLGALRSAMRQMKARYAHPYYWAPFIGIGTDAPVIFSHPTR